MNKVIAHLLRFFLGRRNTWRLGRALYLNARLDIENNMLHNGEAHLQRQLIQRFSENKEKLIVFDVGANVGDWTGLLLNEAARLKVESRLEVYAFEPVASTFKALKDRILNHPSGKRVQLVSKALSNRESPADIHIAGERAGTNSLHVDPLNQNTTLMRIVRVAGNTYCRKNHIKVIHYLKCDTEGHDMEVIQGFKRLFEDGKIMAFQFEYNHRWVYSRHYLKDVFDLFAGSPYSLGKVTPEGIEIYPKWHPELERFFEGNYVLLHRKARDWFTTWGGEFDAFNTFGIQNKAGIE